MIICVIIIATAVCALAVACYPAVRWLACQIVKNFGEEI